MAYTELSLQTTVRTGLNATYTAALATGHAFNNIAQDVILHVKNANASPCTVTIGSVRTVDGRTLPALTVSVPNGGERIIGPFPEALYSEAEPDTGLAEAVKVNYSITASVTVAALKIGPTSY